jgi:hypothetical protein
VGITRYGNLNSDSPVCLSTDYISIDRSASGLAGIEGGEENQHKSCDLVEGGLE